MLTVTSPRDPALSARLTDTPDGVQVEFARTHCLVRARRLTAERYVLGAITIDAPLHLVADRVHDVLAGLTESL
jgi:hypothetical protein